MTVLVVVLNTKTLPMEKHVLTIIVCISHVKVTIPFFKYQSFQVAVHYNFKSYYLSCVIRVNDSLSFSYKNYKKTSVVFDQSQKQILNSHMCVKSGVVNSIPIHRKVHQVAIDGEYISAIFYPNACQLFHRNLSVCRGYWLGYL